jgi:sulfatase maturation enzyme AslB (radical SAM superfamily)
MYIQLTSRCNMTCTHCCFNCTAQGSDISVSMFEAACKLALKCGHDIFLGGGEPTLHPKFWQLLGIAMAYTSENHVGIITNGSMTDIALRLAEMACNGQIFCGLSRDVYHDYIDPKVYEAFTRGPRSSSNDMRQIRDVSYRLVAAGRSKDDEDADKESCCCNDVLVTPRGRIYSCGCKKISCGTVYEPSLELLSHRCYREAA